MENIEDNLSGGEDSQKENISITAPNGEARANTDSKTAQDILKQYETGEQRETNVEENFLDEISFTNVEYLGGFEINDPRSIEQIESLIKSNHDKAETPRIPIILSAPRRNYSKARVKKLETNELLLDVSVQNIIYITKSRPTGAQLTGYFAFTCAGAKDGPFLCHIFHAKTNELVAKILLCFQEAFQVASYASDHIPEDVSHASSKIYTFCFETSLEIQEKDTQKNNFVSCTVENNACFKIRKNHNKKVSFQILQIAPESPRLVIEKCFGVLIAAGKKVTSQDFVLLEDVKLFRSGKQFVVSANWSVEDEALESLNVETPKDARVAFKVAADVIIAGIPSPVRFSIQTRAKISSPTDRIWSLIGKKQINEMFYLRAAFKQTPDNSAAFYEVLSMESGSTMRARQNLEAEAAFQNDAAQQSDDEPLMSGFGEVRREFSEEELRLWSNILDKWRKNEENPPRSEISNLVRTYGIPQALRAELWQRIAGCFGDAESADLFKTLMGMQSSSDSEIVKDISRTFPAHEFFKESGGDGQESLFHVCKAFSLYDSETGYHQSLSFIAACLLIQMPEEQAFGLLCRMMSDYKLRELVDKDFEGLRLKYYQLERLLEDKLPALFNHFAEENVEVHMFASQWFLTLFTAKFPLPLVFRIVDLFLLDGESILLTTAFCLLKCCKSDLLDRNFEECLKYFRVSMPKQFLNENKCNQLLQLICSTKISTKQLEKYQKEYEKKKEEEKANEDPLARITRQYRFEVQERMRLERENDSVTNELITFRLRNRTIVDKLEEDNEKQMQEVFRMRRQLDEGYVHEQNLMTELNKIKDLYRENERERERKEASINGYKQVNANLSRRLEDEEVKCDKVMAVICEKCRAAARKTLNPDNASRSSSRTSQAETPLEQKVQQLENELAKTKLALVDTECNNQTLRHQLITAQNEMEKLKTSSWSHKLVTSFRQSVASNSTSPVTSPVGDTDAVKSSSFNYTRSFPLN